MENGYVVSCLASVCLHVTITTTTSSTSSSSSSSTGVTSSNHRSSPDDDYQLYQLYQLYHATTPSIFVLHHNQNHTQHYTKQTTKKKAQAQHQVVVAKSFRWTSIMDSVHSRCVETHVTSLCCLVASGACRKEYTCKKVSSSFSCTWSDTMASECGAGVSTAQA